LTYLNAIRLDRNEAILMLAMLPRIDHPSASNIRLLGRHFDKCRLFLVQIGDQKKRRDNGLNFEGRWGIRWRWQGGLGIRGVAAHALS
jgi:hypothetical protein